MKKDYSKPIGIPKSRQQQPERRKAWTTLPEPDSGARAAKRGLSALGIVLAVVAAAALIPATFKYQMSRIPPPAKRASRMYDLVAITQTKAIDRFGQPNAQREYQLMKGSVMGPLLGQKNYVPLDSPDYAPREKEAKVIWSYPTLSAVRELTWKLPDSYLTIWFQEPRAEVSFSDNTTDMTLPTTGPGEWVALDNYRVGFDLVNAPKASPGTP